MGSTVVVVVVVVGIDSLSSKILSNSPSSIFSIKKDKKSPVNSHGSGGDSEKDMNKTKKHERRNSILYPREKNAHLPAV